MSLQKHSSKIFFAYIVQNSLLLQNNVEALVYALGIPVLVDVPFMSYLPSWLRLPFGCGFLMQLASPIMPLALQ